MGKQFVIFRANLFSHRPTFRHIYHTNLSNMTLLSDKQIFFTAKTHAISLAKEILYVHLENLDVPYRVRVFQPDSYSPESTFRTTLISTLIRHKCFRFINYRNDGYQSIKIIDYRPQRGN